MPTYVYRCEIDGSLDVVQPMGSVQATVTCPTCGGRASRVFTAPHLASARQDLVRAIDRTERTASEPDVVTSLPSEGARRRTPMAPPDPRLRRLPRP